MINTGLPSGYSGSLFSQSMAGFFHESKSAILDNALRQELVSKARVLATKVPLASAIINTLTRGVVGSGLHLSGKNELFDILSATYSFDACSSREFMRIFVEDNLRIRKLHFIKKVKYFLSELSVFVLPL